MAYRNLYTNQVNATSTPNASIMPSYSNGYQRVILLNLGAANAYYGSSNTVNATSGAILRPFADNIPETQLETTANVFLFASANTPVSVTVLW